MTGADELSALSTGTIVVTGGTGYIGEDHKESEV